MNIVISIFNPPEYFPPTLSGIEILSKEVNSITVITRNVKYPDWSYPTNVKIIRVGKKISFNEYASSSFFSKLLLFISFVSKARKIIRRSKPAIWLAYDNIGLFALSILLKQGMRLPKLFWYHSHDVIEDTSTITKYTLAWFAFKDEKLIFKKLNVFSLPSEERLKFYPIPYLGGKYYIIPNYPSKFIYSNLSTKEKFAHSKVKLIYQGSISPQHGLEEIIPLLNRGVKGKELHLTLIGHINQEYKKSLQQLASDYCTVHRITFLKTVAYSALPQITSTHDIGLAIHKPASIIYSTGGTASNKIYEYAAVGLPVLLYESEHYKKHLERFKWTFFTDCSEESIISTLSSVGDKYEEVSKAAKADFFNSINYEAVFKPVFDKVVASVST